MFAAVAVCATGAAVATDGAAAVRVRLETDPAGAGVNFSCLARVATDGAGFVHAVWQDDRDAAWSIRYRRAERNGDAWSAADRRLSDPREHSFDPRVAVAADRVYVAWRTVAADGAVEGVRVVVSTDRGATFCEPVDLSSHGAATDLVRGVELVARPDGGASVLWIASAGAIDRAFCSSTEPNGSRFGDAPVAVSSPSASVSLGRIAAGAIDPATGRATVCVACAERRPASECDDVVVHVSSDGGATFPAALATCVASLPLHALGDLLLGAASNGAVHVLWLASRPAERLLVLESQCSRARGEPASWLEKPLRVAGGPGVVVLSAALDVDADGAAIAAFVVAPWLDRPPSGLFTRGLAPAASAWSDAAEVEAARGATAILAPRLAGLAAGDRPHVVGWLERRAGSANERPRFAVRARAADPWRSCLDDVEPAPAKRRASALTLALATMGGGLAGGVDSGGARLFAVFDDRCGIAPGAADAGLASNGAPNACCVQVDLQ